MVNQIANADCLEYLAGLPDEMVDLVLTDPPYGIGFFSNRRVQSELVTTEGIANDGVDNLDFLREVAQQLFRILKHDRHFYWFTRWDKIPEQMPMLQECGVKVKNVLIWEKNNKSMGDLFGAYANQYECILFGQKGSRDLNEIAGTTRHIDILKFDRISPNDLVHSHQKPLPLLEFLIAKSTIPEEIVLDPFMGSGSTAIAALGMNRQFLGCELSGTIHEIAMKRLQSGAQLSLL